MIDTSSLQHKFGVAINELRYRLYNLTRPRANAAIHNLAVSSPLTGDGSVLYEALWDHPYHWLRVAMFRNALADQASDFIGLYEEGTPKRVLESMRAISPDREFEVPLSIAPKHLDHARELMKGVEDARGFLNLKLPFGFPAYHVYDGILKKKLVGTLDVHDPFTVSQLAQSLHYLDFHDRLFDEAKIKAVIVSHPSFPRFSTLVWSALRRGIHVYSTIHANEHIVARKFTSLSDFNGFPQDRPKRTIKDIASSATLAELTAAGHAYYGQIRAGVAGEFTVANIYSGESNATRRALCEHINCAPDKPNIVIFGNCWADAPNAGGTSFYNDYQDLFEQTLRIVEPLTDCNWIFRPHPAEYMYGDQVRLEKLIAGRLADHIHLWPKSLPGNAVVNVADCIVTASGTSGIEYTALGKPVLTARQTNYTDWGIGTCATDFEDYAQKLSRVKDLPHPTLEQIEDAYIFYALSMSSPPKTRQNYRYEWASKSWNIWPTVPKFINDHHTQIQNEIRMIRNWIASDIDSYNTYKWLNRDRWSETSHD